MSALVLPKIRRPFEALPACRATKRTLSGRLALVVQQFRRLLEMQLAQVALEEVLAGVSVHVPYQVLPVLEGLLANGAFIGAIGTVSALVVCQMRSLTEALVARVALVGFLARVHSFMPRELRKVPERLVAHRALVRTVGALKSCGGRGTHSRPVTGRLSGRRLLGVGRGGIRPVRFFTDRALHWIVSSGVLVVMLRQRSEKRESHFAHAAHKRLLLHLDALML